MTSSRTDGVLIPLPGLGPSDVVVPAAKTRRPRQRVSVLRRDHLIDLWDGSDHDVTLVLAPPGFGKTTLVSQWAQDASAPVVWATVEPTDRDPVVLISTLLAAIDRAGLPVEPPPGLTGDEPAFTRRVLPQLRHCLEQLGSAVVLVVDDVHETHTAEAAAVLTAVVESLPAQSRVVLVGRSRPDLPVARWRSEGRLLEVGPEQLRFEMREMTACLGGLLGRRPSPDELALVASTSEGWPVAVYLEGTALGRDTLPTHSPSHGLEDYLRSEVLDRLDDDLATFLRHTSVLTSLSGAVCDHVLGRSGSAEELRRIETSTLLVVRLEGPGGWYRVHPLLREALAARLREESPDLARALHARAARWNADHAESDDAVRHAIASGDATLVQEVGWRYGVEAIMQGRTTAVRTWLQQIPERDVEVTPGLAVLAAWTGFAGGDSVAVARWGLAAERALGPDWRDDLTRSPYAATLALRVCLNGTLPHDEAASLAGAAAEAMPVTSRVRVQAVLLHGWHLLLAGETDAGARGLADSQALAQALGVSTVATQVPALLGYLHASSGDLVAARHQADVALRAWVDRRMEDSAPSTQVVLGLDTYLNAQRRPVSRTRDDLLRVVGLSDVLAGGLPGPTALVLGFAARTWALIGDSAEAREALRKARTIEERLPRSDWLSGVIDASEAEVERLGPTAQLSEAQRRVLVELGTDKTMNEIAADLHLSINTVKSHARDIYRKLGISTRREARRIQGGD